MSKNIHKIITAAVFAVLISMATLFLRLPSQGYINAGDGVIIISGVVLGPFFGFLSSAIGAVTADIISGFVIYAPATFIIKGLMALAVALLIKNRKITKKSMIIPSSLAELIMILGYFLYEISVFGFGYAVVSLPGNLIQALVGILIAVFTASAVNKIKM